MLLSAMFCWKTLDPGIYVVVILTHTNNLNIVADKVQPFMVTVFPGGSGLFQWDNAPFHSAKFAQEQFKKYDIDFKVLPKPKIPEVSIRSSGCGMCYKNKSDS